MILWQTILVVTIMEMIRWEEKTTMVEKIMAETMMEVEEEATITKANTQTKAVKM